MTFGLRLITTILITLLLAVSHQRNLISSRWPKPPVRLPVLALLIWVGTALPFLEKIISKQTSLTTIGQLTLLYATISLGGWLLLEIPGALDWWHPPAKILRQLSGLILAAILTLIILQQAGVNLAGLITTSALLTGVVAFAAQEPLKDIFGGLSLQLDQPFKEGDWIQIGEDCGQVIMLTLMNTYLLSGMDGCTLIIPNDTVAQATIRRVHLGTPYGNCFEVGLDYGFPPSQALSLLLGVVNSHASVLTKPAPKAWVASFEDSYICYGIQVWHRDISDVKRLSIRGELMEQIWYALERIGQSIPYRVLLGSPKPQTLAVDDPMCADAQRKVKWLTSNALFTDLSQAQLDALAPSTRCVRFAKGETIIRQGESGDCLYQVITGTVEVSQTNSKGQEITFPKLGQHEIFGEMALCMKQPRNSTVRALEESVLLEVERRDLQPLIDQDQGLIEKLARLVHLRQMEIGMLNKEQDLSRKLDNQRRLIRSMHKLYKVIRGGSNVSEKLDP